MPIDGVDASKDVKSTFGKRNGEEVTFEKYYKNKRNVKLNEAEEQANETDWKNTSSISK